MVKDPAKVKSTVIRTKNGRKSRSVVEVHSAARTHRARIPENYGARREIGRFLWKLYSQVQRAADCTFGSMWKSEELCSDGTNSCPCILHWKDDLKGYSKFWPGSKESARCHECVLGNGSSYYFLGISPAIEGQNAKDEEILVFLSTSQALTVGIEHRQILSEPITRFDVTQLSEDQEHGGIPATVRRKVPRSAREIPAKSWEIIRSSGKRRWQLRERMTQGRYFADHFAVDKMRRYVKKRSLRRLVGM